MQPSRRGKSKRAAQCSVLQSLQGAQYIFALAKARLGIGIVDLTCIGIDILAEFGTSPPKAKRRGDWMIRSLPYLCTKQIR